MDIHNTTEDIVIKYLDELLESKQNICKCDQCKKDMICYALNRVKPMYLISSRGIIHTENKRRYGFQDTIDIYTTVSQAIETISNTRRHEIKEKIKYNIEASQYDSTKEIKTEYLYNFPQLVGRIIDGYTLLPVESGKITLFDEKGKNPIPMFNDEWSNPVEIVPQMKGTFSFWPAPIPVDKPGLQKDFFMSLLVEKEGYEFTYKFFFVRLVSSNKLRNYVDKENLFYIEDIFINRGNRKGGR